MASIGDLFLKIRADGKGFEADVKKQAGKAGDAAGKTMGQRMSRGFKDVTKGFGAGLGLGAGIAAFGALDSAVQTVVGSFQGAVDAASDFREAVALGDQVFETNADEIREWAETAAESMGASATEAINLSAQFGNAFKNVGFSLDETTAKSIELAELAGDLGSAFNRSSEEAATALRSGLLGESEPLRAFGVFLSEAAVKAKAVEMGIAEAGEELTDQEKVLARYQIILEDTADSAGMFGRDSESLADAQKRLGAEVENLARDIGEELVPVLADIVTWVAEDGLPAVEDFIGVIGDLATEIDGLRKTYNDLSAIDVGGDEGLTLVSDEDVQLVEDIAGAIDEWGYSLTHLVGGTDLATYRQEKLREEIRNSTEAGDEYARRQYEIGLASENATQDIDGTTEAVEEFGDEVRTTSGDAVKAWKDIVDAFDQARSDMASAASGAAESIYGPQIAWLELYETKQEIALLEEKRRNEELSIEEQKRLLELQGTSIELMTELVSFGELSGAEQEAFLADLVALWGEQTGEAQVDIANLIASLGGLDGAGNTAANALDGLAAQWGREIDAASADLSALVRQLLAASQQSSALFSGGTGQYPFRGPRAGGGPVFPQSSYLVGEEGPELFVPRQTGQIVPADVTAAMASAGTAVGDTYVTNVTTHGLPLRAETPFEVAQQVRRVSSLGLIGPRRRLRPA